MTGDESRGLPSALLLGDKTYLSDSTRRDFSRAGVSHLLAISGLHVTLIFGMLAVFLRLIGVTPAKVVAYANTLLQESGGIGEYRNFVHIDVRHEKSRWRGI